MISAAGVRNGLDRVRNELADGGIDPTVVSIVAMTKGLGVDAVRAAVDAGITTCGENNAAELRDKAAAVSGVDWHFTGRLQSNKVRVVAAEVVLWQSLDRLSVIKEVAKRAPGAAVLVQVNASGEAQKGGAAPADVPDLVLAAGDLGLEVRGLMTIGVAGDEPATSRAFVEVANLADSLGLAERSFGMSGDLRLAAAAGTTMIRVGTVLFGRRPE